MQEHPDRPAAELLPEALDYAWVNFLQERVRNDFISLSAGGSEVYQRSIDALRARESEWRGP